MLWEVRNGRRVHLKRRAERGLTRERERWNSYEPNALGASRAATGQLEPRPVVMNVSDGAWRCLKNLLAVRTAHGRQQAAFARQSPHPQVP